MIKEDIFTSPIEFALQETMKRFEGDEKNELLYEALKRSEAMWENIKIHNLQIYGLTYEQFCEQFENKKNIVFLSDDEVESFNKAVQIMNVMKT